jgi:hypothetical protein
MRRKHRNGAKGSADVLGSFALSRVVCAILSCHQEVHIVIRRVSPSVVAVANRRTFERRKVFPIRDPVQNRGGQSFCWLFE